MTAMARGWRSWAPEPTASARGAMPKMVASAVIKMGRSRRRPDWKTASFSERPCAVKCCSESSIKMPFLWTMPITIMMPMKLEILRVWPVTVSASRDPEVQRIVAIKMAKGWANERNSKTRMMKISTIDMRRTWVTLWKDSF